MNKKVVYILLIISILTILFGFFAASNIRNELVSGYNETSVASAVAEIGSSFMSVVIVSFSFFIVGIIWLVYFAINFVKRKNSLDYITKKSNFAFFLFAVVL